MVATLAELFEALDDGAGVFLARSDVVLVSVVSLVRRHNWFLWGGVPRCPLVW